VQLAGRSASCYQFVIERLIRESGIDEERFVLVKGFVEDTLEVTELPRLSYLRLDTDDYLSTKTELECLYPILSTGGVLMIDDYGYFLEARKAVDEYFAQKVAPVLLNRIDHSGRSGIKMQ
jgi:hypothetical protein